MRALLGRSLLLWKIRARLECHTFNHNFCCGPGRSLIGWRAHDDFGVVEAVDYPSKDRILFVERRLFFQSDEPLAVCSVNVAGAGRAQRAALVRNIAELRLHVWIRRVAGTIDRRVISFRQRIAALDNPETRVDTMNR